MSSGDASERAAAHRLAGWNLFRVRRFADALREAQLALGQAPRDADAHRLRSLALSMLGRHDESMEALVAAITIEPRSTATQHVRAHILLQSGQLEPALEAAREAIRLEPRASEAHSLASEVLLRLGRNREARDAVHAALALDPRDVVSLVRAAHAAVRVGEKEAALAFARQAVAGDPQSADAHRALGVAAYRAGDRAAALTALREALRLDPQNDSARFELLTTLRGGSPIHRAVFAMQRWMRGLGVRLACVVGVLVCGIGYLSSQVLGSERFATFFLILPLTLFLPLWLVPLHDLLVWCDPLGRFLLHRSERAAAVFTAAVLAVAAALGVAWLRTGDGRWGWLAGSVALYAMFGSLVRSVRSRTAVWRVGIYCAFVAGDLVTIAHLSARSTADAMLFILFFPTLWMGAFIARSWLLALPATRRR